MNTYCLACEVEGHATTACRSTHALNTPRAREVFRLMIAGKHAELTVAMLQRELLSLCPSSRHACLTQPQVDALTNAQRQDRIAMLRRRIAALDPNASLYYGWAGPGDDDPTKPHRRKGDEL